MENELYHHGVKGMKWGVRKARPKSSGTSKPKKSSSQTKTKSSTAKNVYNGTKTTVSNVVTKRKTLKEKKLAEEKALKAKQEAEAKAKAEAERKKNPKNLTDTELRERITRLELEKRYRDLNASVNPEVHKGRDFVYGVLETSGKNVATQLTTYAMGTAVNKVFEDIFDDPAIINPKKGQKDK